ncbi:MAG: preprotein translocase subunit SecE [Gammaproteobacteria bacterium]|nr:preprotein translocase subunit SecE [Gammaproteobacteria bacterium]
MAETAEQTNSVMDTVKLVLAAILLLVGFYGFYQFADQPLLYRVLGILLFVVIAAGIALTTTKGRALTSFMQSARTEVRKMVWPTRAETLQTTLVILVVVILVGLFLWLLDTFLGWIMSMIIG